MSRSGLTDGRAAADLTNDWNEVHTRMTTGGGKTRESDDDGLPAAQVPGGLAGGVVSAAGSDAGELLL